MAAVGARRPDFPEQAQEPPPQGDEQLFYEASMEQSMESPTADPPGPQPTILMSQEHFVEALTVQMEPVNVVDMIRRCQLGGRLYSDQDFTAEPSNIMPELKTNPEDVEWKRVGELRVAPQLFAGAMCGGLIVRSTTSPVDDGSFLGAVGAVAIRPDLL